jgi:hypothetical protein
VTAACLNNINTIKLSRHALHIRSVLTTMASLSNIEHIYMYSSLYLEKEILGLVFQPQTQSILG